RRPSPQQTTAKNKALATTVWYTLRSRGGQILNDRSRLKKYSLLCPLRYTDSVWLLQSSFSSSCTPRKKTSRIVPVPKKNRPSELNDFRPVALTSHLMKTLELALPQPPQTPGATRPGSPAVRLPTSAFNTIQPTLLRDKLSRMGVDPQLMDWISDYLTGRPQYVGLKDITSDTVTSATTRSCVIFQKYADDTAIVGCIRDDREEEYRRLVGDFAAWCHTNHLQLNTSKTKELVIDFGRSRPRPRPVLLEGAEVEAVDSYRIPRAMARQ
ncbi:hypothetical protein L3Q82_020589, partial [Scortum barcoo]